MILKSHSAGLPSVEADVVGSKPIRHANQKLPKFRRLLVFRKFALIIPESVFLDNREN